MKFIETILISLLGGVLFTFIQVPLSWVLGPMAAVLLWTTLFGRSIVWPQSLRNGGLMLLGYSLGLSFTMDGAKQIIAKLPFMFIATFTTIVFCLLSAFFTSKFTGINLESSVIGSIPGGLSQMVVLGEEVEGADQAVVVFMQTVRLMLVVFIVPFIAVHGLTDRLIDLGGKAIKMPFGIEMFDSLIVWGEAMLSRPIYSILLIAGVAAATWIAVKLHFPTAFLIGPLIAVALFTITETAPFTLPPIFILMAQWSVGVYLGAGMKLDSLRNWKRLLPYTIIQNIALIGFTILLSYLFSSMLPMTLLTAFLGLSPGGMAEMGITADLAGADVSVVIAFQLFRTLFILLVVSYVLRWWFARGKKREKKLPASEESRSL